MFVCSAVHRHPGRHHKALSHSAELVKDGAPTVRVLDVADLHQGLVDGLEKVLVHRHLGAGKVGLLRLGRNKEELALFLKTLDNLDGLFA